MSREEIQKLLGGYATDTLSEAERRALFEAALEDQELFDALAKEQALREVFEDPAARAQLVSALGPPHEPFAARAWRWLRHPATLAVAGGLATLLIVGSVVLQKSMVPRPGAPLVADAVATRPRANEAVQPSAEPRMAMRLPIAPPPALPDKSDRQMALAPESPVRPLTAQQGARLMARAPTEFAMPAIEYTLLLKDADGAYSPVPPGSVFHTGDSVRIQVLPRLPGYIYLFERDPSGGWKLVTGQRVETAQRYMLGATDDFQSNTPARLELLLVLSPREQPAFAAPQTADVDALASQVPGASIKISIEFR
jgi:hypothetical protein